MKKKIVRYIFIQDAFGPLPVWTFQHPIKEAQDAYMIPFEKFKDKPLWFKTVKQLGRYMDTMFRKLCLPLDVIDITVSGELDYHYDKESKTNIVDDFKLEYWTIESTFTEEKPCKT